MARICGRAYPRTAATTRHACRRIHGLRQVPKSAAVAAGNWRHSRIGQLICITRGAVALSTQDVARVRFSPGYRPPANKSSRYRLALKDDDVKRP